MSSKRLWRSVITRVKTSSRPVELFGLARARTSSGSDEALDQRHQVGPVALEHGAVAQVDLLEGDVLDLFLDRRVDVGEEGAAQRPGFVAEAQVDAGGLDRLRADPVLAGADPLALDRLGQRLRREDARARARVTRLRGRPDRALGLAHPAEIIRRAASVPRCGVSANSSTSGTSAARSAALAGDHPAAEQRGDPADHRFVGRGRDLGAPPGGSGAPSAQERHEALDRGLVAVVDAAAGAQALGEEDRGERRLGREQAEQGDDAGADADRPLLRLGRRAGVDDGARASARSRSRRRRGSTRPCCRSACRSHSSRPPRGVRSLTPWSSGSRPRRG